MRWFLLLCLVSFVACHTTENPQDKGFLEWISSLLGGSTTQAPIINDPPVMMPPTDCPVCQCGLSRTRRRIVGGNETKVLEYPWTAPLLYNGRFYCAASLINDLYVLTAAHCTAGFRKEKMVVRFLEHDRALKNETMTIDRKIAEIIRHQRYNPGNYDNDIAMLKLDKRIDLSSAVKRLRDDNGSTENEDDKGIRPVCLPEKGRTYTNYTGIVTGWGTTEEGGSVSNILQQVSVPIISNEHCRTTAYKNRITENMLCAGYLEGGKDACQGDSGGPLHVMEQDKRFYEVGVVSWGEGCAREDRPGVYTRVNRYLTWINSNTKDACYCS